MASGTDRPVVLLIDDEVFLRRSLARLLRRDFEVLEAGSAREAADRAKDRAVDLILTDHCMPGEDGVAGLRRLRRQGVTAPALIVTATVAPAVMSAVAAGLAQGWVEKPWEPDRLLEWARALVGRGTTGVAAS